MVLSRPVTRWHFVRHAPVIGADSLLYATHDEAADVTDAATFDWLAKAVPAADVFISSGLRRTDATAAAMLAAGYKAPAMLRDARFAEQHYGTWHGAGEAAIAASLAPPRHNFWFTTADDAPPGGERFRDVARRVAEGVEAVTAANPGAAITCVAHGGTIRAALAHALGIDLDRALTISVHNLSVTRIDHMPGEGKGGDWRTVYVNRRAR